jgi:Fe-S cluster assembly ATP-binding protein
MDTLLEVKDLHVSVDDKPILRGVNLTIKPGEIHVLMGPNGAGKSTLANAIMAHPKYTVTQGDILLEGRSILEEPADQRAREGIFMSFQAPQEVPGISVEDFLRSALSQKTGKSPSVTGFHKDMAKRFQALDMAPDAGERYLNVGFSGGEKKKTEMVQMQVLDPKLVIMDETDSGLDVDAVRVVSKTVADFLTEEKSCLIITHIDAIMSYLEAQYVHVLMDGKIVKEGGPELFERIQKEGYGWIRTEEGGGDATR